MHRALPPPLLKIKKCVYVMIWAPPWMTSFVLKQIILSVSPWHRPALFRPADPYWLIFFRTAVLFLVIFFFRMLAVQLRAPNFLFSPLQNGDRCWNGRGGACVPARTSAQRRFHTKNTCIVRWEWMMDAPLQGDTGGHTGTAPTHLHHAFLHHSIKRHHPSTCNPPIINGPFGHVPGIPSII